MSTTFAHSLLKEENKNTYTYKNIAFLAEAELDFMQFPNHLILSFKTHLKKKNKNKQTK